VRQRNSGPSPLLVPSIPAEVQPGEVIDQPDLIVGFEPEFGEAGDTPVPPTAAGDVPDSSPAAPSRAGKPKQQPKNPAPAGTEEA
jgi:hypothetical protein